MKKIMMLLFALIAIATAEAQNVYIAPSNSAIAYHKAKSCSYLKNSVNVKAISTTEAKNMGRHACVRCYPELKDQTMKAIAAEKKTTAKKTTTVKKTTTTKKTTPERDEKGRFVKKATADTKVTTTKGTTTAKKTTTAAKKTTTAAKKTTTAAKKTTPERDEKGRFVKKSTTETKATTKSLPERDEKGRFVKKTDKAA